jgi:Raf kinase inhibitor-like YbhB/YbcL family protein
MRLQSKGFADGVTIPRRFTCDGENISPALQWSDAPPQTKSFVLLCDDPDAPAKVWRHWAAYDISGKRTYLEENEGRSSGHHKFRQAINDFLRPEYGGPCPPHRHGTHHYHFRLLALAISELPLRGDNATCEEVEREARKHMLAEATLVGLYER